MVRRILDWLGVGRARLLFLLLAVTGTFSLMLQAVGPDDVPWVVPVQNLLILLWLAGSAAVIVHRLEPITRRTVLISVGPLLAALGIGMFVPGAAPWFIGAGVGWLVVSQVLLRRSVRREYQDAIRHLRKNEYKEAIKIMSGLVKTEPEVSDHRRFRAELYRLQGNFERAIKDYHRVITLEPDSAVGYNGLAEVYLQQGDHAQALTYARQAYERAPNQWEMPYNLGMVEDRLGMAAEAAEHLQAALDANIRDSRHRLLVHFWLARAYFRLGRTTDSAEQIDALRQQKRGLQDWETIFENEQAATLRAVLEDDITQIRRVIDGAEPDTLFTAQD